MKTTNCVKLFLLLISAVLGLANSVVGAETDRPPVVSSSNPNIIFIFADDWGYGDLSLHGSDFVKTPHIDHMAAEGIDFQNFTVNSPVCSPSRVAAISGQFPARFCIHQHFAAVNLSLIHI